MLAFDQSGGSKCSQKDAIYQNVFQKHLTHFKLQTRLPIQREYPLQVRMEQIHINHIYLYHLFLHGRMCVGNTHAFHHRMHQSSSTDYLIDTCRYDHYGEGSKKSGSYCLCNLSFRRKYLLFGAEYWYLCHRGYSGVSNVVLGTIQLWNSWKAKCSLQILKLIKTHIST